MSLLFQKEIKRSKRKLSIQLNLSNSPLFSQNSSISTPAKKKKKLSFFSQSQPAQLIQEISIYPELPIFEDSESIPKTQKGQIFVEIPKKTSFDFSKYSPLSTSPSSRTPLKPKDTNIRLSQSITDYI